MEVSARKLGAVFWETNGVPSPEMKNGDFEVKKERRRRERLSLPGPVPPHLSDPSHTNVSQRIDETKRGEGHRRTISTTPQKLQLVDYNLGGFDSGRNGYIMEIEPRHQVQTINGHRLGIKTRLKDMRNGLVTSKELLKVLSFVCRVKDYHSITSLYSALRTELDRAHFQVDMLIQEQRTNQNLKQIVQEKTAWKSEELERIHEAGSSLAAQLEKEKKMRRQTERLNKKLGTELADTKLSLSIALKEIDREKRAREVLEQACDELAKGINEDRAEVEHLKWESVQVREEVEREKEMLYLADILREERVRMKLSEAKYHFEEKNAAMEELRRKLEGYLSDKVGGEKYDDSQELEKIEELRMFLRNAGIESCNNQNEKLDGIGDGEEDSGESDLHSIELDMDHNKQSSGRNVDSRGSSIELFKGRKSLSNKIQWESISLNRGISDENDWIEKGRLSDFVSQARKNNEDEIKKYRSTKCVGDQLFSTSTLPTIRGFPSPTRQWGESTST